MGEEHGDSCGQSPHTLHRHWRPQTGGRNWWPRTGGRINNNKYTTTQLRWTLISVPVPLPLVGGQGEGASECYGFLPGVQLEGQHTHDPGRRSDRRSCIVGRSTAHSLSQCSDSGVAATMSCIALAQQCHSQGQPCSFDCPIGVAHKSSLDATEQLPEAVRRADGRCAF